MGKEGRRGDTTPEPRPCKNNPLNKNSNRLNHSLSGFQYQTQSRFGLYFRGQDRGVLKVWAEEEEVPSHPRWEFLTDQKWRGL